MAKNYSDSEWTTVNGSPKLRVKENRGNGQLQFELGSSNSSKKVLISVSKDMGTTYTADGLDNLECLKIQIQSESHTDEVQSQLQLCKENSNVITTAQTESLKLPGTKGKNSIKEKMRGRGKDNSSSVVSQLVQMPLPLGSTLGHKEYLYGNGRFVVDRNRKDLLKSTVKEIVCWRIIKATNQVLLQKFVPVIIDGQDMHKAVDSFLSFEKTEPSFYDRFQPIIFHLVKDNDNNTLGYRFDLDAGSVPYFGYFELTDKYYNDFQLFLRKMAKRALQDEVTSNWSGSIEGSSVIRDLLKEIYKKSCFATLLPSDFMECVMEYPEILKRKVGNANRDKAIDHECDFCKRIGKSQKLKVEYRMIFVGDPYSLHTLMLKPSSDQPRPPLPEYRLCYSCGSTVRALHRVIHFPYSLFIAFRLQLKQLYSLLKPGESYKAKEVFDFLLENPHFNRMTFYEWQAAHGEGIHFYKRCENKVNRCSGRISSQNLKRTQGQKGKTTQTISKFSEPSCTSASSNSKVSVVSQTSTTNDEEPCAGTSSSVPKVNKKKSQSEISVTAKDSSKVSREKSLLSVRPNPNPQKPRQKLVKSSDASSGIFVSDRPTENLNGEKNISVTSAETAKHVVRSKNSKIQKRNPRTKDMNEGIAISQNSQLKVSLASEPDELSASEKPPLALSIAPEPKELCHSLSASKEIHNSEHQSRERVDSALAPDRSQNSMVETLEPVPPSVIKTRSVATSIAEDDIGSGSIASAIAGDGKNVAIYKKSNKIQRQRRNKSKAQLQPLNFINEDTVPSLQKLPLAVFVGPEPNHLSHNVPNPKLTHNRDHQNLESVDLDVVQDFSQVVVVELSKPMSPPKPKPLVTSIAKGRNDTDKTGVVSTCDVSWLRNRCKTKILRKEVNKKQDFPEPLNSLDVDVTLSSQPLLAQPVAQESDVLSHNMPSPTQIHNSADLQNPERVGSTLALPGSSPSALLGPFERMPQLIIKLKRVVISGAQAKDVTGSSGSKSITSANVGDGANVVSSKKKYTAKYTLRRKNNLNYKEIRQTRQIIQNSDHIALSSQLLKLVVPVGPEAGELQQNFKISTSAQKDNQNSQDHAKWPVAESTRIKQDLPHNKSECLKRVTTKIQNIGKQKQREPKLSRSKKLPARKIIPAACGNSVAFKRLISTLPGNADSETLLWATSAAATVDTSNLVAVASSSLVENDEGISSSSSSASGTNKKTSSQSSVVSSGVHNNVVLPNKISSKNQFSQETKVKNDNENESTSTTPSRRRNSKTVSKSKANFKKTVPVIILKRVDEDDGKNDQIRVIEDIPKGKVESRILLTRVEEDPKLQLLIQPSASSSTPNRLPNSRDARSGREECSLKTTTDEASPALEIESRRLLRRSVRPIKKRVPYSPSRLDCREIQKHGAVEVSGEIQTTAKNVPVKVMSNVKTILFSRKLGGPYLKSKSIKPHHFSKTQETTKQKAEKKAIIALEIKRRIGLRNGNKIPRNGSDSVFVAKKKKGM